MIVQELSIMFIIINFILAMIMNLLND